MTQTEMPYRTLGLRIVRSAVDRGSNFMDNSWDYNGGESERRVGKALEGGYRDRVFLMTKIDGRSKCSYARGASLSGRRWLTMKDGFARPAMTRSRSRTL